jgi:Rrf2 family transcriptional regulator, cysteine metabolism repressor
MFKFHKKVEYALTALKHMRSKVDKELTTAKEICTEYDIPFDPTSRVLQIMAQNKILEAVQGAYGGYRLKGDLSRVTIYDLSTMIIGPMAVADCTKGKSSCTRRDKCLLKGAMGKLNSRVLDVFKKVKVSEMV